MQCQQPGPMEVQNAQTQASQAGEKAGSQVPCPDPCKDHTAQPGRAQPSLAPSAPQGQARTTDPPLPSGPAGGGSKDSWFRVPREGGRPWGGHRQVLWDKVGRCTEGFS